MVLSLSRILITQNNEEIMLTRILQLGICKKNINDLISFDSDEAHEGVLHDQGCLDLDAAEFYALFFFHCLSITSEQLSRYSSSTVCDKACLNNLTNLTSQLLVMLSTIFTSGKSYFMKYTTDI